MESLFSNGITCLINNDFKQAHEIFKGLNEKEPSNPFIMHNLGLSYECIGQTTEAIETYEKNIQLHPKHLLSYFCLSNCNLYISKLHKAICWLKKAEDECGETIQGHILFSEASFLAGNPSEGCIRHARALELVSLGQQQLTNHHVQCYVDYGDGAMHFYSWIENSYISHNRKPTVEFVSGRKWDNEKVPPMLVLVNVQNAQQVVDQARTMSDEDKSQMYVVAQDRIVERLLGDIVPDARVVSSAPSQSVAEYFSAYALDVAHVIIQNQEEITRFRIPYKDTCVTVDGSRDATSICPMLVVNDDHSYNVFALSGFLQ